MEKLRLLTNSMRSKFAQCHRAYKIAYVDLIRPAVDSDALSFGTQMHALLEKYWKRELVTENDFPIDDPYRAATLKALFDGYCDRWIEDDFRMYETVGSEIGFSAPLMNPETGALSKTWQLAGKIDAIAKEKDTGRYVIVEHKTTSSDIGPGSDYWKKIPIDGQVSGYYVGASTVGYEAENCLYDVIRKPTIKPSKTVPVLDDDGLKIAVYEDSGERAYTKRGEPRQSASNEDGIVLMVRDETPEEWAERLEKDIAERPDYYFARLDVARSSEDLAEYLFDMWAVGREIADAERMGRFSRNPQACSVFGTCEYFDVCTGCASIDDVTLYKKIKTPNPELENNTNQKG